MARTLNLFSILLTLMVHTGCNSKPRSINTTDVSSPLQSGMINTAIDTLIQLLKTKGELTRTHVLNLQIIDSFSINSSDGINYCDTTVQVNDSIFYSIIRISDRGGNCTHSFIITFNEKSKQAITSQYLQPDCDIDFSWDSYELYKHTVIANDKIQLTKKTIIQKKNRPSANEEDNIEREEIQNSYFYISSDGKISLANS